MAKKDIKDYIKQFSEADYNIRKHIDKYLMNKGVKYDDYYYKVYLNLRTQEYNIQIVLITDNIYINEPIYNIINQ